MHTDSEYAEVVYEELLRPLGLRASDVALLTESNTVYGGSLTSRADGGSAQYAAQTSVERTPEALEDALVISFPLNVASVRDAYDLNPEVERPNAERTDLASRLPLSLRLAERPREAPSARSRLTAPALDLVLRDMIETLRAHRIRAVGIMATDIRDKLFLAELIREELHDVVLFTFEGNALFARRDLSRSLRGMVVVSSYPLILQNASWTASPGFVPFSSEGAAGVFNAMFHLLEVPHPVEGPAMIGNVLLRRCYDCSLPLP